MSYQSVDVYILDAVTSNPVDGVLVRVFDAANKVFYSQAITDSSGRAGFTLWTNTYNLRFYKFGAHVDQPQIIQVTEPAYGAVQVNAFNAYATTFVHPVANDPRLCRASGFFRDVTGAPQANLDIHIIGEFAPILLEGAGVLSERKTLRTDKAGFACVDLIRCAQYKATVQGTEDTQRSLSVPDAPSANLPDLLFPVVDSVSLEPAGPYTLAVGATLEVVPTVLASNGVPLTGPAGADVRWSSSNSAVMSVGMTATSLVLTGVAAGTAELQVTRLDTSIIRIPQIDIQGVPQVVTVT